MQTIERFTMFAKLWAAIKWQSQSFTSTRETQKSEACSGTKSRPQFGSYVVELLDEMIAIAMCRESAAASSSHN